MALVRAIESSRPEVKRICYDPIARSLIPGYKFFLSRLTIDSGLYGRFFPGAIEFITARERYIDDFLKACLGEGLDQVVILGAGFDTRAYRIEESMPFGVKRLREWLRARGVGRVTVKKRGSPIEPGSFVRSSVAMALAG